MTTTYWDNMSGFKYNCDDDNDDEEEEDTQSRANGYCHFNNDGSSTTFTLSLFGQDLAINQSPDSRTLGHGAVVWDSAVIFTKYLEENPSQCRWQDKTAVELGCGPGLSGIASMLKGAAVTMTDLSKVTESLTIENAHRIYGQMTSKGSGTFPYPLVHPVVYPLDWTDWESFAALGGAEQAPFDLVITTDCVFAVSLVEPLISCIRKLSGPHTTVYCCHEIRDEEANACFLVEFGKYFTYKTIPRGKLHPQYRNDLVQLIVGKPIRASKLDRKGDAHTLGLNNSNNNNDAMNKKDSNSNDDNAAHETDPSKSDYDDATSKKHERDAVT